VKPASVGGVLTIRKLNKIIVVDFLVFVMFAGAMSYQRKTISGGTANIAKIVADHTNMCIQYQINYGIK